MSKYSTSKALYDYAAADRIRHLLPNHTSSQIRTQWALATFTGLPPCHPAPESWMDWGTPVSINDAAQGDTVILKAAGKFTVGLFHAWGEQGTVQILDAKPGHSSFPKTAVRGIRRLLI